MGIHSQAFRNAFHVPLQDPASGNVVQVLSGGDSYVSGWGSAAGMGDAANDGKIYARQNLDWTEITDDFAARVLKSGDTMTGKLTLPASTTALAPLNVGDGVDPSAPVNGDIWVSSASALFRWRSGGFTYNAVNAQASQTVGGAKTFTAKTSFATPTTSIASILLPHGVAPSAPANGDLWSTTADLFFRQNGVTVALAPKSYVDTADALKEDKSAKGAANGYAPLDASTKISATYLPAYVDDVLEYANLAAFPATGTTGIIYVAIDTGKVYRWSGSIYVELSPSPGSTDAVPEGATNKYYTDARAAAAAPVQTVQGRTGAVVITKTDLGLENVDNTSDINKPVSTATQTALNLKAPLASPTFTGTPNAPTQSPGNSSTLIATTAFVAAAVAAVGGISPSDTAPAMDGSGAAGVSALYSRGDHVHPSDTSRAPLASPALTGTPTAPTAAAATNSTQIATTAFVKNQGYATLAALDAIDCGTF